MKNAAGGGSSTKANLPDRSKKTLPRNPSSLISTSPPSPPDKLSPSIGRSRKTDRLSSCSSFDSIEDWDMPAGAPSPAESVTPSESCPTIFARMATLPEDGRFVQRREHAQIDGSERPTQTLKAGPKLKKVASAKERSLLTSSMSSPFSASMDAFPAEVAAEVEQLKCQLAEMEGEMLSLRNAHAKELAAVKQKAATPRADAATSERRALLEQVELLTQENEGLRCELLEASRARRALAEERDKAVGEVRTLETQLREVHMGRERERRDWQEEQRKLEFMLEHSDIEAEKRSREVDAARREVREQRQLVHDLRKEMESNLAAAEAQIRHQATELAAAQQRADNAESARGDLFSRGSERSRGDGCSEQVKELEVEVARLISALAEKEIEVRRERGLREFAATELKETHEALETQSTLIRDKVKALKKEKEMAMAACEKRMAAMQREISVLTDEKEAHQEAAKRSKASAEKAEQYLKALDVARVEVKRLRLERDLLTDRLRVLERNGKGGGVGVGWFMPECLLKRAHECGQVSPFSVDRDLCN